MTSLLAIARSSVVRVYRIFGLVILFAIVLGMFSYLVTSGFFWANRNWVVPVILTPQNDKVVQANFQYLEQAYQVQKLESERLAIQNELAYVSYAASAHEDFQKKYNLAAQVEQKQEQQYTRELEKIVVQYSKIAPLADDQSAEYLDSIKRKIDSQFKESLIDSNQLISGQYLLSQIDLNALDKMGKLTELKRDLQNAKSRIASAEAGGNIDAVLRTKPFRESMIQKAELLSKREPLEKRLSSLDELISSYQKNLFALKDSLYVRAATQTVVAAFSPYQNLPNVKKGSPIFGCYLKYILCREVGEVTAVLEGEVLGGHPMGRDAIRGQMVTVHLKDASWAEASALMVNRRPLLF